MQEGESNMDISVKLANSYFSMLKLLSDETKLHLIKMLTDSILKKEKDNVSAKSETLEDLFGVWADDPEADEMIKAVETKCSGLTRHIVPLDE